MMFAEKAIAAKIAMKISRLQPARKPSSPNKESCAVLMVV